MANNKEFCGNVKLKEASYNGQSWKYHEISFSREDLKKLEGFFNKDGYATLNINKSLKGNYYMCIDTYGLEPADAPQAESEPAAAPEPPAMQNEEFPDLEEAFKD